MKINKNSIFFMLFVYLLIFLISCSTSKPEITYGFLQLNLYKEDTGITEYFSFFIIPHDEDGIENLDKLFLYNDSEQLRWEFSKEDWISHQDDYRIWIGTRSITTDNGKLPRGVYRAVLVNKGGESSEKLFTFDGNVRFSFPEFVIHDGNYNVISEWPSNKLLAYDASGVFVTEIALTQLSGTVSSLRLPSNVVTVSLWAEDESNMCSAFTEIVSVR